jgi:hypothetical protein
MKNRLLAITLLFIFFASAVSLGAAINRIQGMAAHDAAASGNPIQLGGVASSGAPTAVANGDAVRAYFDLQGRQVVTLGSALQASVDSTADGASATVDGLITYRFAANGTNAALVASVQTPKASPGRLYALELRNTNTNVMYVHVYDTSSPVVGTTQPIFSVAVPGGSSTQPGLAIREYKPPITFGTSIKIAATTSDDHTVSTAPGVGISGTVAYK